MLGLAGLLGAGSPALAQPLAQGVPFAAPVRYDGQAAVRVENPTAEQLEMLLSLAEEPLQCGLPQPGQPSVWRVRWERLDRLAELGIAAEVVTPDLQRELDIENQRLAGAQLAENADYFADYRTYEQMSLRVNELVDQYPGMASRFSIGTTAGGRDIFGIRIARPGAPADQPAILLNTLIHAREWITGTTGMYIADELLRRYGKEIQATQALDRFHILLIPVLNPDGYVHSWTTDRFWRKNRRNNGDGSFGVDLNRNFGFQWDPPLTASTWPEDMTYRGPAAFSEPETAALRDFVTARPYIRAYFDIHSFSQLIMSPWAYTSTVPPRSAEYAAWNVIMQTGIARREGVLYRAGQLSRILYRTSGSSADWAFGSRGIPAWGYELRSTDSFVLPTSEILPSGREVLQGLLDFADGFERPLLISAGLTPSTPTEALPSAHVVSPGSTTTRLWIDVRPGTGQFQAGSLRAAVRLGRFGEFTPVTLTPESGNASRWWFTLPAMVCGSELFLDITAQTTTGQTVALAAGGPGGLSIRARSASASSTGQTFPCPTCRANFNADEFTNLDDLGDYISAYYEYVNTPPWPIWMDVSGDMELNLDDLGDFITLYYAGQCN
jgi:murein tripeptide amidase MpaA